MIDAIAMGFTFFAIFILRRLALRLNWVDIPGGRKDHTQPTPLVGGISMGLGFTVGALLLPTSLGPLRTYFLASLILIISGFLDDLKEISYRFRFFAQILAASLVVLKGGVEIHTLGNLWGDGPVELGIWSVPLTVFAIVGVTNAINMLDGLDGLAGGFVWIAVLAFYGVARLTGASLEAELLSILASVLISFLFWNIRWGRYSARVFMGDAGSLFLGFSMAWFAIRLTQPNVLEPDSHPFVSPLVSLLILAIPIADTLMVMIRRVLKRSSPFLAAQDHAHHYLMKRGWGVGKTVGFFWLAELIAVVLAFWGGLIQGWSDITLFILFWLVFLGTGLCAFKVN